jgi:hypothetical protein
MVYWLWSIYVKFSWLGQFLYIARQIWCRHHHVSVHVIMLTSFYPPPPIPRSLVNGMPFECKILLLSRLLRVVAQLMIQSNNTISLLIQRYSLYWCSRMLLHSLYWCSRLLLHSLYWCSRLLLHSLYWCIILLLHSLYLCSRMLLHSLYWCSRLLLHSLYWCSRLLLHSLYWCIILLLHSLYWCSRLLW